MVLSRPEYVQTVDSTSTDVDSPDEGDHVGIGERKFLEVTTGQIVSGRRSKLNRGPLTAPIQRYRRRVLRYRCARFGGTGYITYQYDEKSDAPQNLPHFNVVSVQPRDCSNITDVEVILPRKPSRLPARQFSNQLETMHFMRTIHDDRTDRGIHEQTSSHLGRIREFR